MSVILCHLISYCVISFYAAVVACCRGDTQYFRWLKDSSDRINVPHVAKFDKTTVECNRSQIYIYIFFFQLLYGTHTQGCVSVVLLNSEVLCLGPFSFM